MDVTLIIQGLVDGLLALCMVYMWIRCRPLWSWRKQPKPRVTYKPYKPPRTSRRARLRLKYRLWRIQRGNS